MKNQIFYNKLTNQTVDIESRYLDRIISGLPFFLENKLPITIYVVHESNINGIIQPVDEINPHGSLKLYDIKNSSENFGQI